MQAADTAVELWVMTEALVDSWHADQDDRDLGAVVFVSEELQGCLHTQEFLRRAAGHW
jgi:hypothetical protein